MIWIAPTEKDNGNAVLEKRLWDAADQFRANSGLKSQEYSAPVLGLIFLRFAEVRFTAQRARLEKGAASSRRGSRVFAELGWQTAFALDVIVGTDGTFGCETLGEAVLLPRLRSALERHCRRRKYDQADDNRRWPGILDLHQIHCICRTRDLLLSRLPSGQVELASTNGTEAQL
jgi:hypothetical protein